MGPVAISTCEENLRLLDTYKKALDLFSAATYALKEARPTSSTKDYHRLRQYQDQARRQSEDARRNWEEHQREHGC